MPIAKNLKDFIYKITETFILKNTTLQILCQFLLKLFLHLLNSLKSILCILSFFVEHLKIPTLLSLNYHDSISHCGEIRKNSCVEIQMDYK